MKIGQPGDKYEQEADQVANAVVDQKSSNIGLQKKKRSVIQRESLATPLEDEKMGTAEERVEEDKLIQEKPGLQAMDEEEEETAQVMEEKRKHTDESF